MKLIGGTAAAGALLALLAACSTSPAPRAAAPPAASAPATAGSPVPSAPTTQQLALAALPADIRARIPKFEPAPPPEPVTLPSGPKAPIFSTIPTTQKIAFITMDDGLSKNPLALKLFQAANVPVTLFLEIDAIKDNPDFFKPLAAAGGTIEAHTISHPSLPGLSYAAQKNEICGGADRLKEYYGTRPTLFRPPYGNYNATTLKAVHDCGMKAAFYWMETTDHGVVFWQRGVGPVHPGDIILMHFRPKFVDDFLAVLNAIHKAGLTPARLEDYIP